MSSQEAYIQIASSLGFRRSDKLVGAEPNAIKASFPSSCVCLFICRRSAPSVRLSDRPSVHPLPGIYADLLDLEVHGDAQVITHTPQMTGKWGGWAEKPWMNHLFQTSRWMQITKTLESRGPEATPRGRRKWVRERKLLLLLFLHQSIAEGGSRLQIQPNWQKARPSVLGLAFL